MLTERALYREPILLTIRPPSLETFSRETRLSAFGFRLKGLAFDQQPAPSRSLPRQPTRVRLPRPSCSECAGIGSERMEGVLRGRAWGFSTTVLNYVHRKSFGVPVQKGCKCTEIHELEMRQRFLIKNSLCCTNRQVSFYKIKSTNIKNKTFQTHWAHSRPRTNQFLGWTIGRWPKLFYDPPLKKKVNV